MPTALVTGASTGIGRAAANALKQAGFTVFAGVRSASDAAEVEADGLEPVRLDVTDDAQVSKVADHVLTRTDGRLDVLVNNAGIAIAAPVETLDVKDFERVLQVNVVGVHRVTHAFLPAIIAAKGRVVTVGSISGKVGLPTASAYAASKHAVEGYSDSLRREVAPLGVHVAVIEPGAVATPIWDKTKQTVPDPDRVPAHYARLLGIAQQAVDNGNDGIPPEDVAEAIVHAATSSSPRARYPLPLRERILGRLMPLLPERVSDTLVGLEIRRMSAG